MYLLAISFYVCNKKNAAGYWRFQTSGIADQITYLIKKLVFLNYKILILKIR